MDLDDQLRTIFPQIETHHCLEIISDSEFDIYDSEEGRCFINRNGTHSTSTQFFKVINPDHQALRFLAIDKCLFFDNDQVQRCDCLLYNEKYLCFIELKKVKGKQRKNKQKIARKQLESTIRIFQERFKTTKIDFEPRTVEAYVCVGYQTNPETLPSGQNAKMKALEFKDKLKEELNVDVELYELCQKSF